MKVGGMGSGTPLATSWSMPRLGPRSLRKSALIMSLAAFFWDLRTEVGIHTNASNDTLIATLTVNGGASTQIAFPPASSGAAEAAVTIQAALPRQDARNVVTISSCGDRGPTIKSIAVYRR
jgi:hypothetical protein